MFQQALEKVSKQVLIRDRYANFIGGKWVAPVEGRYFDNPSPITGKRLCQVRALDSAADIELALDAAHKAKDAWGKTPVADRSPPSSTRSPTSSKPISNCSPSSRRSTTASRSARRPMPTCRWCVDHWRYFAGAVRAQEGRHFRDRPRHRRLSFP